mmetsp:Transcript_2375/g.5142  ORF Transcript_2375/g.5142 Transcript_2375/m.5142 type:complete len:409 (-) Transcript_2375:55-1281(-)
MIYSMAGPGRWRTKLRKPQNRLLLAMSIYDLLYSLAKGWTFLLTPKGFGVPGAQGNMSTCRMQGFFIETAHATGAYNSLLSIYFWLTICKGVKPATFSKYEPYLHILIFVIFFAFASVGVAIELFNPGIATCFIGSYPPGCESGPAAPPCERFPPQTIGLLYQIFAQMWVQAYIVIVTATNVSIWMKVREQDKVIRRYSTLHTSGPIVANPGFSFRKKKKELGRSRSVDVQSTLYVCAFIACWIGPTIFHLIGWVSGFQSFWALFVIVLFTPLQGFWNAFVFVRPTYLRLRRKCPELGRFQVARIVFLDPDPMKKSSMLRSSALSRAVNMQAAAGDSEFANKDEPEDFVGRTLSDDSDEDDDQDCEDEYFDNTPPKNVRFDSTTKCSNGIECVTDKDCGIDKMAEEAV